jgi:hypothetical protein
MVTARVAIDYGRACVTPRSVCSQLFSIQRIVQINKLGFVKFNVAHVLCILVSLSKLQPTKLANIC